MASANPLLINAEDDDEFDWEAAVREIDVACQNASTSTSSLNHSRPENRASNFSNPLVNNGKRPSGSCKQLTLDSFIGKAGPVRQEKKWVVEDTTEGFVGNNDIRAGVSGEGGCCVEIDREAAKTWIYPVNIPLRQYQLAITRTALFSNTLVALPTGLGKTLIAAVVMYNYFRWFPKGKIVFTAPSRPLVIQQIEACHNIMGIPQEWAIEMTGQICPIKRTGLWESKRVFFVTPQVLEKDIQAGTCPVKSLVCLVIDEAHRASGKYAYCVAVRELMAVPVELRILALSATPGSKQQAVQQIIDNLQISTLEYRNESDPDVIPYVHNRKIELIQVAMGKDATDLNKLLLDVVRPYVSKLSAFGLLPNRDFQTLSPPDFLNSRAAFRQAPPPNFPSNRSGEVEACFACLITLYHTRKLLSSHGIKPAYEMLAEKMKQKHLAGLMSKHEGIQKVKLIMERSLTHGAPNPKLSKMLEILVNHFQSKGSQNSRVIIFSNFRGSVRDIMDSLARIGDLVKPTEFIGQSSGKSLKSLKGQSQKVQQAVLQKFRDGGFNVIVATSIGEEGLDIMEVDLVICFDANVSPLRMVQRMGRTGRKHDGRVDILLNWVPHIFKPEVQYVEMEIEQYIPRGKKVIDGSNIRTPIFTKKLTAAESDVISKYFQNATWRPSLIAFPSVQTYPSSIHHVMHSSRTEMLIDAMQYLQPLSFIPGDSGGFSGKVGIENTGYEDHDKEDFGWGYDSPENNSENNQSDYEEPMEHEMATKSPRVFDLTSENHPPHSSLFGSDFVSVDSLGNVLISYVPSLPLKVPLHNGHSPVDCTNQSQHLKTSDEGSTRTTPVKSIHTELTTSCETKGKAYVSVNELQLPETANSERDPMNEGDSVDDIGINAPSLKVDDYCTNYEDAELSPRLTNMLQSGVVPESPMSEHDTEEILGPRDVTTSMKLDTRLLPESQSPQRNESNVVEADRIHIPLPETSAAKAGKIVASISPALKESESPLTNISSRDWLLSSSDKSDSVKPVRRLKRLRKVGEHKNSGSKRDKGPYETNPDGSVKGTTYRNQAKHERGKRKQLGIIKDFIEEEAEVSPNGESSDDEIVDEDDNTYEPSFIDDRMNPTQPTKLDMMAVYRRSLLSQSPMPRESPSAGAITPNSDSPMSCRNNSGSSSAKMLHPLHDSVNHDRKSPGEDHERKPSSSSSAVPCSNSYLSTDIRKRKFSLHGPGGGSVPIVNLEEEFSAEARNNENAAVAYDIDDDMFYDDRFFATLDSLEAQALSVQQKNNRPDLPVQNLVIPPPPSSVLTDSELDGLPSFDLGI
ncbi:DEAD-box ATP-dependent RNA helicase FANCM [Linum perenne]